MASSEFLAAVVDDDASVARAIARLLRAAGMVVDTYSGGHALLARLASEPWYRPDCIILDMCMPGLDGLALQQRLAPVALPILFVSAHDMPGVREQALSAGAIGYLHKPFDAGELLRLVRTARP